MLFLVQGDDANEWVEPLRWQRKLVNATSAMWTGEHPVESAPTKNHDWMYIVRISRPYGSYIHNLTTGVQRIIHFLPEHRGHRI